ncbi:hypothetical protein Gogos_005249 [Gossypium gossypioides]|uniref:Histone-binding protein RBBP4-like N-terminal domain-containing protein n=1 Tax=Gossypium gossypioides TaxID=34282 RepID=A0A7J9CJ00_GOSGO|nr:hypothetical protein [Gossypium gossypioides]
MKGEKGRSVEEKYTQWKSLVPVLYDWLANHNLVWPSLSCRSVHLNQIPVSTVSYVILFCFFRWGPQLEQATYKTRQRLYLSEQASHCL